MRRRAGNTLFALGRRLRSTTAKVAATETPNRRLDLLRTRLERDEKRLPSRAFFVRDEPNVRKKQKVTRDMLLAIEGENDLALQEESRNYAQGKKYFIHTLGCQMNVADSEIVGAVLQGAGYASTDAIDDADVILLNTCAIREGAESKAVQRLETYKAQYVDRVKGGGAQVGVLGCMAERMRQKLLEHNLASVVVGPDAYRDLPTLLSIARGRKRAMNVQLSKNETYFDIAPLRDAASPTAWVSIQRGCSNMCTYCVVPHTRGNERSRPVDSILREVEHAAKQGFKEVTLLGQNVNSYFFKDGGIGGEDSYRVANGFADNFMGSARRGDGVRFGELLDLVAQVDESVRVRFTSPHPKDFTDDVFEVIASRPNISKGIHLPAQSGSSTVLERMQRGYTAEAYTALVERARAIVGDNLELSSDFISGFCGETEEEHQRTLELLESVKFTKAFMFAYSERERTRAFHRFDDDVPESVKLRRLAEVNATFRSVGESMLADQVGKRHTVLLEGPSKKDPSKMRGRTNGLRWCIVSGATPETHPPGTYVDVEILGDDANSMAALHGIARS